MASIAQTNHVIRGFIVLICTLLIAPVSCRKSKTAKQPNQQEASKTEATRHQTNNEPITPYEGTSTFPYRASESKRNRVLNAYPLIVPGMPLKEAQGLLGPPDFVQGRSRKSSSESRGHTLKYYLYKRKKVINSEKHDIVITFYFDKNDILESKYALNVQLDNSGDRAPP